MKATFRGQILESSTTHIIRSGRLCARWGPMHQAPKTIAQIDIMASTFAMLAGDARNADAFDRIATELGRLDK